MSVRTVTGQVRMRSRIRCAVSAAIAPHQRRDRPRDPGCRLRLNALISYRERGFVELFDLPAAIAFAILSVLVGRGSRLALHGAIALVAIYLVTALAGGVLAFVSYWIATLVLALQALPVTRE